MKNIFSGILIIGSFLLLQENVFAVGTPAGTVIQNRSRVTYTTSSGSQVDTVYSAFVSITVAQKAVFNITPASNALTTQSDSTQADYPIIVINSGNGNDRAKLTAFSSKGWSTQIFADNNGDGILQAGEAGAGTIAQTPIITADAQFPIIVRVKVPRNESLNGAKDTAVCIIKSLYDTASTISGSYVTTVHTSGLNPLNPGLIVNNSIPSAGQQVIYTFSMTNTGSVSANNISIYDVIPSGCTFISGTASTGVLNGSANPVVWTIGSLAPSQSVTVTLTVQLSSGFTTGAIIANRFSVSYSVASNAYSVLTNSVSMTVSGKAAHGVQIIPMFSSLTKEASDTASFRYNVRNTGAFKDLIELSTLSSQNIPWKLFRDANNNGVWDSADQLLTNTNDSAGVDIDSVAAGDSVRVFAMAVLPRFETDQVKDSLQCSASSAGDHAASDNTLTISTISVPVVAINISAFPIGNQPAGSVITYTISYTNTGKAAVKDFSVIDVSPNATKYIPNSVKVNGVSVSDNTSGVSVTMDQSNNSVIAVSIGTLSANANGSVEFKVKIK